MKRFVLLFAALVLVYAEAFSAAAQSPQVGDIPPALPKTMVVTYPTVTGKSIAVHAGSDFQAALNTASCGDEVVLDVARYTGNFTAPAKPCTGQILVRGPLTGLPAGARVPQSAKLPVISTPNAQSVLGFAPKASNWYFAGIEFTVASGVQGLWNLITLSANARQVSQLPSNIVFDRVLVHGNEKMCVRGFVADAVGFALIDSQVYGFAHTNQDTQAVLAYNSPGPFLIRNNYLEATGENVMFGGSDPTIPGVVPADATVTRNHFHKQMSWKGNPAPCGGQGRPQCYDVKNMFEIKHGERMLFDSNVLDTTFSQGQAEFIIMNCPWTAYQVCRDVTFTNNLFEHGGSLFVIAGNGKTSGQNVLIRNNLATDISKETYGSAGFLAGISRSRNITADHNTVINNAGLSAWFGDPPPSTNSLFRYTNNLAYGPLGANGCNPLMAYEALPSDANVSYSVFVGNGTSFPRSVHLSSVVSKDAPVTGKPACSQPYPPKECAPLDWALVGLVDYTAGSTGANLPGLALAPTSPYHNAGSDGKDIGADVAAVLAATAGVVSAGDNKTE